MLLLLINTVHVLPLFLRETPSVESFLSALAYLLGKTIFIDCTKECPVYKFSCKISTVTQGISMLLIVKTYRLIHARVMILLIEHLKQNFFLVYQRERILVHAVKIKHDRKMRVLNLKV